jgi:hypothetical protein
VNYNTDKAVRFLKARAPVYPVLTSVAVNRETGQRGVVTTKSWEHFHTDAKQEADCWAWIESRQGNANIYYSVNPTIDAKATKASRENIARLVSFHVDLDPRVGEDQDEALKRLVTQLKNYDKPPTWIIPSGGGVQGIWDLEPGEYVPLDGTIPTAEDAKLWNVQLERDLDGDSCHNIDRIMRLPGTENCPDAKKRDKGRRYAPAYVLEHSGKLYKVSDFTKATKVQDTTVKGVADLTGGRNHVSVELPTNITRIINLDDVPELATLPDWVKRIIHEGTDPLHEKSWKSRSEMVFAVCCAMARNNVSDDVMASLLTDPDFKFSKSVLEKKNIEREVTRVISRAREASIDEDLAEMNRKHAVVSIGGKTRVMTVSEHDDTPTYRSFTDFENLHMNRRKEVVVTNPKDDSKSTKRMPMGTWWINHERRRQYEGVVYRPDSDDNVVNGCLNLWDGFTVPQRKGDKHLSFLDHMFKNICRGNVEHYKYLLGWCATVMQVRDKHTKVAVVLRSEAEGTGKSFFATRFLGLFGKHFRHVTNPAHLVGNFNAHLQACSGVFADECFFAGDKKHAGILKTIITEDTMIVEAKGVDSVSVPNLINLIMASNSKFVVPAGLNARRFCMLDVGTDHMQDSKYFGKIALDLADGGTANLLHYFLTYDLTGFDVTQVPQTKALEEQKAMTRNGIDALVEMIAQNATLPCAHYKSADVAITSGAKRGDGLWGFAVDRFPELRHMSPETMMNILKNDWECTRWRAGGQNGVRFPTLNKVRKLFDVRHGKQEWDMSVGSWQAPTPDGVSPGAASGSDVRQEDIPF